MEKESFLEELNDTLANSIDWFPLKKSSTNTNVYNLKKISDHRIEFTPNKSIQIILLVFAVLGALVMGQGVFKYDTVKWGLVAFGTLFCLTPLLVYKSIRMARIFDKGVKRYWVGKSQSEFDNNVSSVDFSEVRALQLLSKTVSGQNHGSYKGYEINLIKSNGERVNVLNQGVGEVILLENANQLAQFLEVPVWNGIRMIST